MAEADGTTNDDAASKLKEALKTIADLLAPEPAATKPEADAEKVVDTLTGGIDAAEVTAHTAAAGKAVDRYRNAMRWLVAAVAAIGVALFGSTALLDEAAFDSKRTVIGLAIAAAGLCTVLLAATKVFEPVESTLGQLDLLFDEAATSRVWPHRWSPRWGSIYQYRRILTGDEKSAHLGPGNGSLDELIKHIGDDEALRRGAARNLVKAQARRDVLLKQYDAAWTRLEKVRSQLKDAPADAPHLRANLDHEMFHTLHQVESLRWQLDGLEGEVVARANELVPIDQRLAINLLHRDIVIAEAAVAQSRGIFRSSRMWLLLGAVMVLGGALLYIDSAKSEGGNDGDSAVVTLPIDGSLTVLRTSEIADQLPNGCSGTSVALEVLVFSNVRPAPGDAFEATILAPERCRGRVEVPKSAGGVELVIPPDR